MPDIYRAGQHIPEMGGTFRAGTTVVLHDPQEVDDLLAMCELSTVLVDPPARAIRDALATDKLDLASWRRRRDRWRHLPGLPPSAVDLRQADASQEDDAGDGDDVGALVSTLRTAREIWVNQSSEASQIALSLTIADTDVGPGQNVKFEGKEPLLVLSKGSIRAAFATRFRIPGLWALALFARGGLAPTLRGAALAERLRTKNSAEAKYPLEKLQKLSPDTLSSKNGLVVFVHGLMSTDLKTFDQVIEPLRASPDLQLAGFPHDTFMPIEDSALLLIKALRPLILEKPVVFVCHSRGGLVVRSAAVQLRQMDPNVCKNLLGCVTFGTPHNGSPLARWPNRIVATATSLMGLWGTSSGLSLLDVAGYYKATGEFFGVKDLQPIGGERDTFLAKLLRAEIAQQGTGLPCIDILAIGGSVPVGTAEWRLGDHFLVAEEHDVVVPFDSSVPEEYRLPGKWLRTERSHFRYLDPLDQPAIDLTVAYIRSQLDAATPSALRRRATDAALTLA